MDKVERIREKINAVRWDRHSICELLDDMTYLLSVIDQYRADLRERNWQRKAVMHG